MTIKYDYNLPCFYNEDDVSYYLLGAFITDGCVYSTNKNKNRYACQLSSKDHEWLESIAKFVGSNLRIHKYKENYFGLRIIRNEIAQWFINHGCFPRKTYTVTLPNIPDKYFSDFMRGCIDGDGSIGTYFSNNRANRSCKLICANEKFLQEIQTVLNTKNIKSSITNRGKQNSKLNGKNIIATVNSYSLNFSGINCLKLLEYTYYKNHKISLNRKLYKANEIINYYYGPEVDFNFRKIRKLDIRSKIQWPNNDDLLKMINDSNVEKVAAKLGVHGTAVRSRLIKRNIYDKIIKKNKRH